MAKRICPLAKVECKYLACAKGACARKTPPAVFKRVSKLLPSPLKQRSKKK